MARRSHGLRSKTREKLKAKRVAMHRYLQEFKPGDVVHIVLNPSSKRLPNPKFHGKTGVVKERRGRAFVVEVERKELILKPEHLKVCRC